MCVVHKCVWSMSVGGHKCVMHECVWCTSVWGISVCGARVCGLHECVGGMSVYDTLSVCGT